MTKGLHANLRMALPYTGDSIESLVLVGCTNGHPGVLSFSAVAGQTYRFQLTANVAPSDVTFELGPPPAPVAAFYFNPSQPKVFGAVAFQDNSTDPAGIGFGPAVWTFGDGKAATGTSVSHTYAKDGDYTVQMTATTTDGRTASASQVVTVRTHDLGIAKFTIPTAAKARQTRAVTVSILNHRYPETGGRERLGRGVPERSSRLPDRTYSTSGTSSRSRRPRPRKGPRLPLRCST